MDQLSRHAPHAARLLLGLIFFVFGLNGFLHFLPAPPMPESAAAFVGGLMAGGYLFPLVKGIEVVSGALLLGNRFVPLALTVLAPIVVNIVALHALLAPAGLPIALLVLTLELWLAWTYRSAFAVVVRARHEPSGARRPHAELTSVRT
jgi:hypothetical protein